MDTRSHTGSLFWNLLCAVLTILLNACVVFKLIRGKDRKTSMLDVGVSHFLVGTASLTRILFQIYDNSRTIRETLIMNRTFLECISVTAVSFSVFLLLIETLNPSINTYFRFSKKPFQNIGSLRVFLWLSVIVIGINVYTAQFLTPTYLGYYLVCLHIIYLIPFVAIVRFLPLINTRYKKSLQVKDCDINCLTSTISSEHLLCCMIIVTSLIVCWFPITSFELVYTYLGKTTYCRHIEPNYVKCLLFGYMHSVITPISMLYITNQVVSKK